MPQIFTNNCTLNKTTPTFTPPLLIRFKPRVLAFIATISMAVCCSIPALAQIDYGYGRNLQGLRLGAGGGVTQLHAHYNSNTPIGCFIGTLDYEFNQYFSAGIEGQIGTLQGIDNSTPATLYISSSTNSFKSINFNLKFGLGLIKNFDADNNFPDAVKRIYLGIGAGVMKSNMAFTYNYDVSGYTYGYKPYGYFRVVPFNIGTFIDIGHFLGNDRVEINPNLQLMYISSPYPDGFNTDPDNEITGFYSMLSLTARLKF